MKRNRLVTLSTMFMGLLLLTNISSQPALGQEPERGTDLLDSRVPKETVVTVLTSKKWKLVNLNVSSKVAVAFLTFQPDGALTVEVKGETKDDGIKIISATKWEYNASIPAIQFMDASGNVLAVRDCLFQLTGEGPSKGTYTLSSEDVKAAWNDELRDGEGPGITPEIQKRSDWYLGTLPE
jgi:hypothetical protein